MDTMCVKLFQSLNVYCAEKEQPWWLQEVQLQVLLEGTRPDLHRNKLAKNHRSLDSIVTQELSPTAQMES